MRLLFLVKMMTAWNWIRDFYINTTIRTTRFCEYMKAYFKNQHDTWLFIPGHTLPLPVSNLRNEVNGSWIYDNSNFTLMSCTKSSTINVCKFSWLSGLIRITDPLVRDIVNEYNIDTFLENLRIHMDGTLCPTLDIIYMAWCAHNKHWFSYNCKIEFKVITELGDEQIIPINSHRLRFNARNKTIFSE